MMRGIRYTLLALLAMVVWSGCTDQRDLYVTIKPMFIIKNDWSVARLNPESATAMIFARQEPCVPMHNDPCRLRLCLDPDKYNILVFNEVMYSPTTTNIEGVVYRGTDQFHTFGAYAKENLVNSVFKSEPDNIMVGYGYPEPLASRTHKQKEVLEAGEYIMKYQNGKNGLPAYEDFDADSVELLPIRVTRDVKVIAHVRNLRSQYRISGTLSGFAEGVLLSDRQPNGADAVYVFDLTNTKPDPQKSGGHTIASESFSTFGPWWNQYPGDKKYKLNLVATCNGELFRYNFDVTERGGAVIRSVGEAMVKIKEEEALFVSDGTPPAMEEIVIEISFDLPQAADGSIEVNVGDWGTDIIIPIPMRIP